MTKTKYEILTMDDEEARILHIDSDKEFLVDFESGVEYGIEFEDSFWVLHSKATFRNTDVEVPDDIYLLLETELETWEVDYNDWYQNQVERGDYYYDSLMDR